MWLQAVGSHLRASLSKVKESPLRYLSIPVTAAGVGYITNYVGVSMLFYPIEYAGYDFKRWEGEPFGLIGWQGVVPCKRFIMCNIMVDVTLKKLLKVSEVFERLEPDRMADILQESISKAILGGVLPLSVVNYFLRKISEEVIRRIESLVNLGDIVVVGMTTDPTILGRFFQKVGRNELDFLVDSGTYFGFLLGLVQMGLWTLFPVYWTLPIGGAVVGFITNWIAIKLIFEPVQPVAIGPFTMQGMFLRRQIEVSAEFSEYISNNLLTSQEIWKSILLGNCSKDFEDIIRQQAPFLTASMVESIMSTLRSELLIKEDVDVFNRMLRPHGLEAVEAVVPMSELPDPLLAVEPVTAVAAAIIADKQEDQHMADQPATPPNATMMVPGEKHPLHSYTDDRLALEALILQRMLLMTPVEFERLLHPIFQEDELTLILAGGVLGLAAGALQWFLNVLLDDHQVRRRVQSRAVSGPPSKMSFAISIGHLKRTMCLMRRFLMRR